MKNFVFLFDLTVGLTRGLVGRVAGQGEGEGAGVGGSTLEVNLNSSISL